MRVRCFLSFVLLVLLVSVVEISVYADAEPVDYADVKADPLVKELSLAIRAKVPAVISVEMTRGKDGVNLFDETGNLKSDLYERSFGFKIGGNLPRVKLSFSGSDGLSYVDEGGYWCLQRKGDKKIGIPISFDFGSGPSNHRSIHGGEDICLDRDMQNDPEKTITIYPVTRHFYAGDYMGKLVVRITAAD